MSSARTSEYTIEIDIKDNTKDAIRGLERDLKDLGEKAAKASNDSFHAANNAAQSMIQQIHKLATDSSLDSVAVVKAFERQSQKTMDILQTAYVGQKDKADALQKEYDDIQAEVNKLNAQMAQARTEDREGIRSQLNQELTRLNVKQRELEAVQSYINQNKQIRADLKQAAVQAKIEAAETKKRADVEKQRAKYEELIAKRKASTNKAEQKALDEQIKKEKVHLNELERIAGMQETNVKKAERFARAWNSLKTKGREIDAGLHVRAQFLSNVTNIAGSAARTGKAIAGAGIGIARSIGAGISMAGGAADQEVQRERLANRIKGSYSDKDRNHIMREVYMRTGADYSSIIDAIGRVQGTLGTGIDAGELIAATEVELKYPGTAQAYASTNSPASAQAFQTYANRMRGIQRATGASEEQIAASTQVLANMKPGSFSNARVTELQTVYLGLQNSGAFDTQEKLDRAFEAFVSAQKNSKQDVFDFAANYDFAKHVHNKRNRLQAENTIKNLNWAEMGKTVNDAEQAHTPQATEAEKLAMDMRRMEEARNKVLISIMPVVSKVAGKIADLMNSSSGEKIINGLVKLFETVIPMLDPVFSALGTFLDFMSDSVLPKFEWMIEKLGSFFGGGKAPEKAKEDAPVQQNTSNISMTQKFDKLIDMLSKYVPQEGTPQNAAGGLAFMPSIVGERGPEAIIPLDFSRSQRASNIAASINQTFNMGSSQTTALSLAQAVRTRDFERAMTDNAFTLKRCGVF